MKTLRKNLWALFFLVLFIPFMNPGEVKADQENAATVEGRSSFKIVGGSPVTQGAFPWTVQIGFDPAGPDDFEVWCGGALIDDSWVLTAAHCLDDTTVSRYTLTLGEHDLTQNEGTEQVIQIQEIVIHPNYREETSSDNDIALLRLASPAQLSNGVGIVEIGGLPVAATPLTVVGWGRTIQGGPVSNVLLQTHVPLRTDTDCRNAYPGRITDSMFCAGFDGGGTDSCQGDSGGPIFFDEGGGEWRQVGVVSWGIGCAQANLFGVYTDVALFTDWINQTIGGEPPVPIPNVIGQAQTDGEAAIVSAGLTVGSVTTANHPSVPTGNVISQNPTAGTMGAAGSPVDLVVSAGPGEVTIIPISPPPTVGSISEAGMVNLFEFTVKEQGSYTIETKGITNGMDTVVSLFESDSQITPIEQNDDIVSGNVNSRITTSLVPGTYVVKVRHYHSTQVGDYTIFVRKNE